MGINKRSQLSRRLLRGALFENLTVLEVLQTLHNSGIPPSLHFCLDSAENEADLLPEVGNEIELVETKSGKTIASDAMSSVVNIRQALDDRVRNGTLICGGGETQRRSAFAAWRGGSIPAWLRQSS